ncbi:MAG: hypothetical protein NT113_17465, partial [Hyphomicrobiales bacterium]|nr:hypothetical protein [Hyphomicrobiales bacterium]
SLKEPSLLDFLPGLTETADIDDTFGKMALMDRLIVHDEIAKVIDLGYHAFDEFFRMTAEIGFAKEAARRGVAPIVLFMGDSDRASLRAYETLQQQYPQRALYVIDNEQVLRGEIPPALGQGKMLHMAALPPFLKTYIDRLNFSFTGYLRSEQDSSTELHQWIRTNYFAFRQIELSLLLM